MVDYENAIGGIRIIPGSWRPHYPWEHIAWISPPWPSQDYVWYDFPEAIFTDLGLIFLSHINPAFPVLFPDQPSVPWVETSGGMEYERILPGGISFGGRVAKRDERIVETELHISNGTDKPLTGITLQTCIFLRAIKEFSEYTAENKYVHTPDVGWVPFPAASKSVETEAKYRVGWRGGPAVADLPVMVTQSREGSRLIATTWGKDTYSLVSNPGHPCMHADPSFPDTEPGSSASIRGEVLFFEGDLEAFESWFRSR